MKQLLRLKTMLLLCALMAGAGSVWGVSAGDTFTRISSVSELSDGDEIIFVNQDETYACGTTQNTNNRTPVSISVSDHSYTYAASDNVQVFVVKISSSGKYGFHTGSGYIYSASTSKNYLKTNTTAASTDPSTTSAWNLSISNYVVSATNVSNNSYYLAFNGTTYFSQYSSGQSKPYIFKKQPNVAVSGISVNPTSTSVSVGGTVGLTATISPEDATDKAVTWSSSNDNVATVNSSGLVTGVAVGEVTITATSHEDNTKTATCTVTVTAAIPVTGVSLNKASTTLQIGATETLTATISPDDATNKNVIWESSDNSIATVSETGLVTAVGVGTATITAKSAADETKTATCSVTVNPIPVESVSLDKTSATLRINKTLQLTATVSPNDATDKTVSWESSNTSIATVSNTGLVTGVAVGTATITVKSNADNTKTSTCSITVNDGAIELTQGSALVFNDFSGAGNSYNDGAFKTTDFTADDTNDYEWSGSNYMSSSGLQLKASSGVITSPVVKAPYGYQLVLTNTNTIKVYIGDSEQTAISTKTWVLPNNTAFTLKNTSSNATKVTNVTITALKPSRSVTFPDGDQTITVDGSTITKTVTVSPAGTATYTSSNTAVATVNASTGEVTAVKGGTAVITATVAADEGYEESKGTYTVTVNKAATTLAFTNAEETVELVDGTATFTATATPADNTRTITYSSDNATVNSSTGAVTYTATGDYTIKANANATDKYLAPSEASYTLHVIDSRVPVVDESTLSLVLENISDLTNVSKDAMGDISASYTKAAGFNGTEVVTIESSDATVLGIESGSFLAYKGGTVTVTVTITSGGEKFFTTVTKDFTVTVVNNSKTATEITILDANADPVVNGDVLNLTYGTPVALDVDITSGYEGTIARALGNDQIVSVSVEGTTYTITPTAVGSTTLTLSAAETANYAAASNVVLTINVSAPDGTTTTPSTPEVVILNETFNKCGGYGGNDGNWSGISGNSSLLSNDTDVSGWTGTNANAASACVSMGTGSAKGSITTPALNLEGDKTYTLRFKAGAWSADNAGMTLSISTGTLSQTSFTLSRGSFTEYTVTITGGSSTSKITFAGASASKYRFFLDEVWVGIPASAPAIPDVTIAASGYGTYCCEYPLNLPADNENYKAYIVTNVSGSTVTFSQISGEIKGGVPFILYGTSGTYTLTLAASSETVPAGNLLVGTLAPKYVTTVEGDYTNFGLSQGSFVKINSGTVPANKAYLPILTANVPSASRLSIIFDDATGISDAMRLNDNGQMINDNVYDLQGRRVATPQKGGLYIVNGKKVLIK